MSKTSFSGDFLAQAKAIVLEEISNDQFGVSELADAMNMSRSNLLRKIKKQTGQSVSQFIRQIRLEEADKLLQETQLTISEISYQVGFSNTSYFIKCYREDFGFPPGEARKVAIEETTPQLDLEFPYEEETLDSKSFFQVHRNKLIALVTIVVIALIAFLWRNQDANSSVVSANQKSIAVLPFKNMSTDSTNLYFVNGLMEASLNNLQKIKDLRVISRTSVEKYRNTTLSAADIAEELNVKYLVEGSGQKIGDEVLLNIQLIDANKDTPVWTEQYKDKWQDVFTLQNTVAKKIALAIEANVTPAELEQIDKKPTENLIAYDYYLQGLQLQQPQTEEGLLASISLFQKAVEEDPSFAIAYAQTAISYYFLDVYKLEKKYMNLINENADKALLYDSKSDLSLIAKALYYISNREFNLAIPHLEKALEYNPNSSSVILILADLYSRAIPNTSKYLKYALKGIQLNMQANDSIGKSFVYLTLSNALIQTGFVEEAYEYINKSLAYNSNNPYSPYLKIFIELAKNKDMNAAIAGLTKEWEKDTTRIDIVQEVAKLYYFQENYEQAHAYYLKYLALMGTDQIDQYPHENLKIGIVFEKIGEPEKAKKFFDAYAQYCENDVSIYKSASLAVKYLYEGDKDAAIKQYQLFAAHRDFQYWMVLFMEEDPLMKELSSHPKYKATMQKIKDQFWKNHEDVKKMLEENGLL
jgi:TolB-like protein/AraC-like DNA-binding protein/thioredoxin-like negative regulator of GroEL